MLKNTPGSVQTTNTILMVRPADFAFNEETAADNEFQNNVAGINVREQALAEFSGAVAALEKAGVKILVVEKDPDLAAMPDAVFPNNWFATDSDGNIHLFPMKTANRQVEVSQIDQVKRLLDNNGFRVNDTIDWRNRFEKGSILEGTGSLILDRVNKILYAALSERTQKNPTLQFARETGYDAVLFHATSSGNTPYYHTNVVMSIGEKMAVVCLDCVEDLKEREWLLAGLKETHSVVTITREQLEKGFCGNLLQVKDKEGNPVTVLSTTAFGMLTPEQKHKMESFGHLLAIDIPVIEKVGGGSIRCMMAEIFCPETE